MNFIIRVLIGTTVSVGSVMFCILTLLCLVPFFSFAAITNDHNSNFIISSFETPAFNTTFEECYLDAGKNQVIIKLSDGSHWFVNRSSQKATFQELISQILQNWHIGDDIRISYDSGNNFALKNLYSNVLYFVSLDLARADSPISLKQIDHSRYVIVTSEGSKWATGWLGSILIRHWNSGNFLTINKSNFSEKEDYLIINRLNGTSTSFSLFTSK